MRIPHPEECEPTGRMQYSDNGSAWSDAATDFAPTADGFNDNGDGDTVTVSGGIITNIS